MQTQVLTTIDVAALDTLRRRGIMAAVAGLVVGGIGAILQPSQILPSWLIGFYFCLGLSLGSLALLMTQHLSGGNWGLVTRRIFEAAAALLPFCLLLFVPVAVFAPKLYVWLHADVVAADPILRIKAPYLNYPFFLVRTAIYFAVWIGCMRLLTTWSFAQDRGEVAVTEADTRRFRAVSAPGLLLYVILLSLAAIDWLMTLDPHWYSTIYGFIQVAGQGLMALSFAVAVLALLAPREPMNAVLKAGHFHDLGKLMLAFVMLWAYFAFSQFLIIWAGNLPEEISYFLERLRYGWQYVSLAIAFGHFILPFCLLLSADLKRRPKLLARVAWYIVAIRLLDMIWLVAPTFNQAGRLSPISLANVGIPVALAGVWLVLFAGRLSRHPLFPVNDPYFRNMLARAQHGGH
jgi:hypothetical protein